MNNNAAKADRYHRIITMEADLRSARELFGFGYDEASKMRNIQRVDDIEQDLYCALDALNIDEMHELAEYRKENVIDGTIGGTVML